MCVPPGFWDRPAVTKAVRARDARTVLHLLRHSAPFLTHEALAAMCGVDQSTITRALNGRGLTRPDVAVGVLNRLGALPIPTDPTIQARTPSPGSQWRARLDADAAHTRAQVRTLLDQDPARPVLDTLETDVDHLCRSYVHTPLFDLYPQISARRRDALTLLGSLARPDQSQRAHTAAARLVGLQAHAAMDTGSYTTAIGHAQAARALADRTGDPALRAWVWALHSLIAYWDRRPADAQRAAENGLTHQVTDSNLARLHALRARAAAAQGDTGTARAAIGGATEHAGHEAPPGVLGFPTGKVHTYASTALLALDSLPDRRRSIAHAERAIALYGAGADRSVGDLLAARLDVATAHLRNHDADGALEQIQLVTAVAPGHRTASITRRARRLAPLLIDNHAASARQASDLLTEFVRTPIPAMGGNG
ncbi:hypothetical protein [Nocardiopsis nanhaiensis]